MGQEYYRRRLKANKMRRRVAATRAAIRRLRIFLRILSIFLILFFIYKVLGLSGWYLNPDLVEIADNKVIKIEGNVITPKYKIVDLIRQVHLPNVQIFRLETKEIEENISKLRPIKKVYVRRLAFPARLNIIIEERVPVFLITPSIDAEPISAITADGVFIDREYMPISPKFKTYKIITYGVRGDDYVKWTKERVGEILRLAKALEVYSKQNVVYIDLRNLNDIYIQLDKVLLRFGEINDTAHKRAKCIATILPQLGKIKQKVKYVDIRWDDANYIKVDDSPEAKNEAEKEESN